MPYEVKLDVFEGPLDLLLHLITRQRVDIYDVSLATITEEYIAATSALSDVDLETATGFLVIAAALLELKSARLLPRPDSDGVEDYLLEERDRLLARLIECATFREAGAALAVALQEGDAWHGRTVPLEPAFVDAAPSLLDAVDLKRLVEAAERVLAIPPAPVLDTAHVAPITASVRDALIDVSHRLERAGRVSFRSLCAGVSDRLEAIVRFLALLELFKAGAIELTQNDRFGEIHARWNGEVEATALLDEVEEYEVGAAGRSGERPR